MEIVYKLIRDICLFIIIGMFVTENTILLKLTISLFALLVYFAMNSSLDSFERNEK